MIFFIAYSGFGTSLVLALLGASGGVFCPTITSQGMIAERRSIRRCPYWFLLLIAMLVLTHFTGCTSVPVDGNPPPAISQSTLTLIRSGSALTASVVLTYAVNDEDRVEKARIIHDASVAIAALANGSVPTPDQLGAALAPVLPDKPHWVQLTASLQAVYGEQFAKLQGNGRNAALVLGAIAAGLVDATQGSR